MINFLGIDSSVAVEAVWRATAPVGHAGERLVPELQRRAAVKQLHRHPRAGAESHAGDAGCRARPRGESQLPRVSLTDVRFTKAFRWSQRKVDLQFDLYNLFNENAVTSAVQTVGPAFGQPVSIVTGRLVRLGINVNF